MIHEPVMQERKPASTVGNASKPTVDIWEKTAGKIKIIECPWGLLQVKEKYPNNLDPVKVVSDYLTVIDIEGTKLLQKMRSPGAVAASKSNLNKRPGTRKPTIREKGPAVGKYHSIKIYQNRIIDLYRKLPETFHSAEACNYFIEAYKPLKISTDTARNKVYAYVNFLKENGVVRELGYEGRSPVYQFVKAPYNAEKPAQADFDPEFLKKQKAVELEAMRRTT